VTVLADTECWPPCVKIVLVTCEKAKALLGWAPRKRLMLDEVDLYYRQWLAYDAAGELEESGIPKRALYGR
jgi:hypothetical protein